LARNEQIKRAGTECEYTPEQVQELRKCITDPIYFITNYVKVSHPTKGLVPFALYEYQERLIRHLHSSRFSILNLPRQQGKTITSAIYLFWKSQFTSNGTFLIASKNESHAKEIAARIRVAYENLPNWLKAGVKLYNMHMMEFDNGSKIICEATTDKTGRGLAITCVSGDTEITTRPKDCPEYLQAGTTIQISQLALGNFPDTDQLKIDIAELEILTPSGFESFDGIVITPDKPLLEIQFNDGSHLKCTPNHLLLVDGVFKSADLLTPEENVNGLYVISITQLPGLHPVYDLINVADHHTYKTNNVYSHNCIYLDELAFISKTIQQEMWTSLQPAISTGGSIIISSTPNGDTDLFANLWRGAPENDFMPFSTHWSDHPDRGPEYYDLMLKQLGPVKVRQEVDCEFLSSDALLINSIALNNIRSVKPTFTSLGFDFWIPDNSVKGEGTTYLITLDPSTGSLQDSSVIEVFEFPSLNQVAELHLDDVNIPLIYSKLKWIIKYFAVNGANVLWTFERNGIGEAVGALHFNDENFEFPGSDNVSIVSDLDKIGLFTTPAKKITFCLQLKQLVEQMNGLNIRSDYLLKELKNFVAAGGTYKGKSGYHDDAVMATVLTMRLLKYLAEYDEAAFNQVNTYIDEEASIDDSDACVPFMIS
jgi:hypothetical protein